MALKRILLVEDDPAIADYVRLGLSRSGYQVDSARDGETALLRLASSSYQTIVLDRMLPVLDGISVLLALRADGNQTPVIILTAVSAIDERVRGLHLGADDYLTKPFHISELLARIAALERRSATISSSGGTRLRCGDLEMDLMALRVRRGSRVLQLNGREFALLRCLMENRGVVVNRATLLKEIWNYDFDPGTNIIDVHVSRLRQKVDGESDFALIRTVRGKGYVIEARQKRRNVESTL